MEINENEQEILDSLEKPKKKKKNFFSRRKARRWSARIIVGILALGFILISLYWIPANLSYRVTEVITISAAESTDLNIVVFLPATGAYQTLTEPEVVWPGNWQEEMSDRMNLLRLESVVQPDEVLTAVVTYRVDLTMGEALWTGEPVLSETLLPGQGVPSNSTEVIARAEALTVENDPLATAQRIYDAVADQQDLTASADRAILLAALNRAAAIPTRVVAGWLLPDSVPLFTRSLTSEDGLRNWNETFLKETWQMEDASCCRRFPKRQLLGWTDGRHLVLDETADLDGVIQSLMEEAGQGSWQIVSLSSPAYAAWSQDSATPLKITSEMKVQKTWDGRWVMAIAVVVILFVLEKMMENDHFMKKSKRKPIIYEI